MDSVAETATAVESTSRAFTAVGAKLESREAIYSAIDAIRPHSPGILVHAAGINRRAPAAEHSDEFWDEVLAVNLTAPFILTRELGRAMIGRGAGKVVFFASMLSFQGGLTVPGYAASKGGVAQLAKAFANEWAPLGVNVNAVAPAYIATDMNEALLADTERNSQITARIPARRWGTPDEMAAAVASRSHRMRTMSTALCSTWMVVGSAAESTVRLSQPCDGRDSVRVLSSFDQCVVRWMNAWIAAAAEEGTP